MIGLLGIDYKTATITEREKFSFNENHIADFGKLLRSQTIFQGVVILFTCNRTEIYFSTTEKNGNERIYNRLVDLLRSYFGITEDVSGILYFKTGEASIQHLFKVVSGFESMIFGEAQIAAQVKDAYQKARKLGLVDPLLQKLFEKALETGKKVRTATKINVGAFSVSYAGIEKSRSVFPDLDKRKIFIIGTGKTGELTLLSLIKKGCSGITITNRTIEKARYLGQKFNLKVLEFSEIEKGLRESHVVFVATGSQSFLINMEMMRSVMAARKGSPMVIIDYAVPRNVDPEIAALRGINLFDVDYLESVLKENTEKRKQRMQEGLDLIEVATSEYIEWMNIRKLIPVITRINEHFHEIHKSELNGFIKIHKTDNGELLEQYGNHITEKYIRLLIRNMKGITENGRKVEYIDALEKLFDLN
ncbi:MAG: glutamyl-tRNA reductase [Chlorobi bacterium]|nr:glutamyl-tRNA reductase [Chlorobiota bacterium]